MADGHDSEEKRGQPASKLTGEVRARRVAPGKVTRTSRVQSGGAVQRKSRAALQPSSGTPGRRARSLAELSEDADMDVAHRGTAALAGSGDPAQATTPSSSGSAGPAVQRRSLPDAQAEDEDAQALANEHADAVESILDQPSPVAGVGDPGAALRTLAALPLGELLAVLDALEQRGRLPEVRQSLAQSPERLARLHAALLIRDMARVPSAAPEGAALQELALALEGLPHSERQHAFGYMMQQRGIARNVRMLIEGFLATESADVAAMRQHLAQGEEAEQPGAAAGTAGAKGAGTGMPAPIGPGAWEPPGRQRKNLYIGNEAHKGIGKYYEQIHRGETVFLNYRAIQSILKAMAERGHAVNPAALTATELASQPDITNISILHLFQIRPEGQEAQAAAIASMQVAAFRQGGVAMSLGPTTDPGTRGQLPAPDGVYLFWSPQPGVIVYQYRKGQLVPVPVPQREGQKKSTPEWRWELKPLTRAQEQALLTGTAGAIMLMLMLMLLAPAGV